MRHALLCVGVSGVLAAAANAQVDFDVIITADNQYGLYTGDVSSVDTYVGGAFNTTAAADGRI